jgi:hypothetical protein
MANSSNSLHTIIFPNHSKLQKLEAVTQNKSAYLYSGVSKSFRTESITKYMLTFGTTRWEATQRVVAAKLTRLTHKMAIQLRLVAESCAICSSRSRLPVRNLLDTPSYSLHPLKFCFLRWLFISLLQSWTYDKCQLNRVRNGYPCVTSYCHLVKKRWNKFIDFNDTYILACTNFLFSSS